MNGHDSDAFEAAPIEVANADAARRRRQSRWRLGAYALIGGASVAALVLAVRDDGGAGSADAPERLTLAPAAAPESDAPPAADDADAALATDERVAEQEEGLSGAIERASLGPPASPPAVSLPVQAPEAQGAEPAALAASPKGAIEAQDAAAPTTDAPAVALADDTPDTGAVLVAPLSQEIAVGEQASLALFGAPVVMVSASWPEVVLLADDRRLAVGDVLDDGHRLIEVERERLVLERDDGTRTVVALH